MTQDVALIKNRYVLYSPFISTESTEVYSINLKANGETYKNKLGYILIFLSMLQCLKTFTSDGVNV